MNGAASEDEQDGSAGRTAGRAPSTIRSRRS